MPVSVRDDSERGYRSLSISLIHVGDVVISCNVAAETKICEYGEVQNIFERRANYLFILMFNGKILKTIDKHPFYVIEREGWVSAQDLGIGEHFRDISGKPVELEYKQEVFGEFTVSLLTPIKV